MSNSKFRKDSVKGVIEERAKYWAERERADDGGGLSAVSKVEKKC